MTKRNVELLTKVRDYVTREPAKFDMGIWTSIKPDLVEFPDGITKAKVECGTTGCVAGWTVQLAGDKLLVHEDTRNEDGTYVASCSVAKNGRICDIEFRARKLLGLTYDEADALFFTDDNQRAIDKLDTLIAGGDIYHDDDDDWDDDDDDED